MIESSLEGKTWMLETRKIAKLTPKLTGSSMVEITFEDGNTATEVFIGHIPIPKVYAPFAAELDLKFSQFEGEYQTTPPFNSTSVKGVYAAGDTVSRFKVWQNAVASGALTAVGVAIELHKEERNILPPRS